ncbi:MAG: amidase [Verrucomicrobiales bacterium]
MKQLRCAATRRTFAGFLVIGLCSGCSTLQNRRTDGVKNRAFIVYWPPPEDSKQVRLVVKDLIDMKGMVTTAGSEYLARTGSPAARDADCLKIARTRNVRIVGRTNLAEFGLGASGLNEFFGNPKNPLNEKLAPGGSSSGSAVAVASGMADVAFGTDTAGSVRIPAAWCGILGLKTTFGLVPLKGVAPLSPDHLDTVGPMAKDIDHLTQGMDLLQSGFAARYKKSAAAKPSARNIKIGRLYVDGTDPAIDKAIDQALALRNFQVIKLDQAFKAKWEQAQKDGKVVALAGGWINDQKYLDKKGVDAKTKAAIKAGELEYPDSYRDALGRKAAWQRALRQVFKKIDFIALPTLKSLPLKVPFFGGSVVFESRVFEMQNTAAVNFAGNPALALPIPVEDKNVPVTSLQLIGPKLSEADLINAGRLIEGRH